MAGQLKNFTVEENQKTWDKYFKYQLEGFGGNQYEKKKFQLISINQLCWNLTHITINHSHKLQEMKYFSL